MRPTAAINTPLSLIYDFFSTLYVQKHQIISVNYGLNYSCKNKSRRRITQNTGGSLCSCPLCSSIFQHLASVKLSVLLTFKKFPMLIQVEAGEIQITDDKCDEKTLQGCSRERI